MTEPTQDAIDAEPNRDGNPALAATAEAILNRRLAAAHWADADDEAHRAAILLDALPDAAAALEAAAPHIRAAAEAELAEMQHDALRRQTASAVYAERQRLGGVLREHYLMQIVCDHGQGADNPVCACSRVHLGWHPTVGDAVNAWIAHVQEAADGT